MKAALFLASVYAALFAACAKVRYVEVPAATHHTFWAQAGASDMVSTSDTIIIHEKEAGDTLRQTVYRTKYVTKYRDHYDTVCYVERDRDTLCPAVLTENLFQDNKEDIQWLLSEEGKQTITDVHVSGITNYIMSL